MPRTVLNRTLVTRRSYSLDYAKATRSSAIAARSRDISEYSRKRQHVEWFRHDLRVIDPGDFRAEHRLATYGTLTPGRPSHHHVSAVEGRWLRGYVHGTLVDAGWGADYGCPALVLGAVGEEVMVDVFESAHLPACWSRLDEFEGSA